MNYRRKLFTTKRLYDLPPTDILFVKAMKSNLTFHMQHCPEYRDILETLNFDMHSLKSIRDLVQIPPLPTSYLKNKTLLSKPYDKLLIKTTSSGTSGQKTLSGFDVSSAVYDLFMALNVFSFHRMISLQRTNYLVLGYQPDSSNQTTMAKALKAYTLLAPAKKVEYALTVKEGVYRLNTNGLVDTVLAYERQNCPVRIVGSPAYFSMFTNELSARGIQIKLHKNSIVLLGGGWKTFLADEISKEELYQTAQRTLGIRYENFKDHFSTAEHPVNYVACRQQHFHVPVFSRVIIRDVHTLAPVPDGTPGLLNLITPLLSNAPYGSILTDDIAVMSSGNSCECGISSPYFELIGRAGFARVRTCTQATSEFLKTSSGWNEE